MAPEDLEVSKGIKLSNKLSIISFKYLDFTVEYETFTKE